MILIYTLLYFLVGFGVLALFYAYAEYKDGVISRSLIEAGFFIVVFWPLALAASLIGIAYREVDYKLQEVIIKIIRKLKYG